ncbi:TPA: hypothetical protein DIC21_00565, partial [Candidatus Uhrbacteria bacterium]|nr:hypothetical protein [Candidatus Uhrbacteria bacterium]
ERVCALTGEKWLMTDEEIGWYKKFNVPPHPWSILTRMKHLIGFFEMYQFWYNKHPETGKSFLSATHPLSGLKALPDVEWFSKDFIEIDQEVDLAVSFFEQFAKLEARVPFPATRSIEPPQNSIVMASFGDIDSYFVMACKSKNSLYSSDAVDIEDSAEISAGTKIQNSFHVLQSHRIFNCRFIHGCFDCLNSSFLFDCRNCEDCFGATNARNKKNLWFNEQLTKDEYHHRLSEVDFSCRSKLQEYKNRFDELMKTQAVWPENFNEKCFNTIGEYTTNAVDCSYLFAGIDGPFKNLYHITYAVGNSFDCAYCGGIYSANNVYLSNCATECSKAICVWNCVRCQEIEYCAYCYDCEFCFGCVGLRKKKFCIFNRQYSEVEYWQKLDGLKCAMLERGEYGQFFPAKLFYGYWPDNGLILYLAQKQADLFDPLKFDPEGGGAVGDLSVERSDSQEIPDSIDDVKDEDWVGKPIFDKKFGRRYSLIKPELDFYRRHRLPAPTEHFIKRVYQGLFLEQNSALFEGSVCQKCGQPVIYAKNATYPEKKIYCKSCYLKYLEENN